jgi:hypothetical protein
MSAYTVFQISPFWYFSTKDIPQSPPFETRDAAEFFAQKRLLRLAKRRGKPASQQKNLPKARLPFGTIGDDSCRSLTLAAMRVDHCRGERGFDFPLSP